jgi:hypothetical protein
MAAAPAEAKLLAPRPLTSQKYRLA